MTKKRHRIFHLFFTTILFLGFLLLVSYQWLIREFGGVDLGLIVFNLKSPLQGTGTGYVARYFWQCIVVASVLTALTSLVFWYFDLQERIAEAQLVVLFFGRKLSVNLFALIRAIKYPVMVLIFLGSSVLFLYKFHAREYFDNLKNVSVIFEEQYVNPTAVSMTFPQQKRNLIFIFVESLESSYHAKDCGGTQEQCLIPNLHRLQQDNISFSQSDGLGGLEDAGHLTIGGMVAQTSGLPMNMPNPNSMYDGYRQFMPGAVTLGDLLSDQGYSNSIMVGSDLVFGGRKAYYQTHGSYDVFDYHTALERKLIPPNYFEWWGFEDQKLYTYAKEELSRLASKPEPFQFTMLTVDTHHIAGYVCPLCGNEYPQQYQNVIACADRQLGEFVDWLEQQEFYGDTTVVVTGDHLSMDHTFYSQFDPGYKRQVYNVFLNAVPAADRTANRAATTLDIFPTTLAAMGVAIDGERLGLGTNLFSQQPTLAEELGLEALVNQLNRRSLFYEEKILGYQPES